MDIGKHSHETFQFYYWDPPKQFHDFACSNNMAGVCGAAIDVQTGRRPGAARAR
jgi:hypothetical protein